MDTKDLKNSDSAQNEQQNKDVNNQSIESNENQTEDDLVDNDNNVADKKDEKPEETDNSGVIDDAGKLEVDYNLLSRESLVEELTSLIDNNNINDIRKEVEAIKASFYKQQKAVNEEKRKKFLDEGGNIDDFSPAEDPIEASLKDQFKRYRKHKAEHNRRLEKDKEINLETKYTIIEELKELITRDESIGDTFKEFRELQNRWKEIGPVPQQKLKDLWNTYHHHVEKFYDYININKELRDLDLKKNLELKNELCEKAEKLSEEPSVVVAFKTLQKFHNQWREIGPVPNENREDVWERFKEATRIINKKHQDYFKNLKDDQKNNLERKGNLCEQAEEIANREIDAHGDWIKSTEEILELQKIWRTIGFAPKKDNNKIYARFRNACDKFFGKKRDFYAQNKEIQDENLQKKIALCEKAEAIQNSNDWKKSTKELINLQKQWKEVGPVSRKLSDKVWKRFRAACDYFFNKKSEYYANIDKEYDKNLKLKQEIIEKVKAYKFVEDVNENFETLKKFQEEFVEIGFVPFKLKDKIQNEFRDELNKQFDKLKIGEKEKKLLKFQTRLETLQHKPKSDSKIRHERDKFFNKIKKLENNITLWENNIGFFNADSEEAQEMLKDYKKKIEDARKEIKILEEKVRMIDKAESDDDSE